eukprot:scaffold30697_cov28-Tisochrysis_lutea.AAC.6
MPTRSVLGRQHLPSNSSSRPAITRNSDDLPAPLGPSTPTCRAEGGLGGSAQGASRHCSPSWVAIGQSFSVDS